jgi:alpha-L-rhamnosidase
MRGRSLPACAGLAAAAVLLGYCVPPVCLAGEQPATLAAAALRTDTLINPLGIGAARPRLSWQVRASGRAVMQSAYEIRVARSVAALQAGKSIWDTGEVGSGTSIEVPYAGPPLQSSTRYWWQVRIWDGQGVLSAWSAPAFWETGLLDASDWKALWISPAPPKSSKIVAPTAVGGTAGFPGDPSPLLRRVFAARGTVRSARVYVTSHGLYELFINGHRVGRDLLTPGWTSYDNRLQYQTYDVTGLLVKGENAIGAVLGDGWYRGQIASPLGSGRGRNSAHERLSLLMQLKITYSDGSTQTVGSDAGWKAADGPILASGIYSGEIYDARRERPGWSAAAYDDHDWSAVEVVPGTKDDLVAPVAPPITAHEEIRPVRIFTTPAGDLVADMGQNMVGWVRLKVRGRAGTVVTLRHAEVLDGDGNFYTTNLRGAHAEVRYTLKGGGLEVYEPHFTYMGFRYVAIGGYPGKLTADDLSGIVVHSDLRPTGGIVTSNPLLNRLQDNIVWSQKGNFVAVPTDCPQRDERLGWTGDAQVFSPTAAFNMDVDGFLTSWLADLAADQGSNGEVPFVVPDVLHEIAQQAAGGAAGWGDAATVIPWNLYLAYGDAHVLEAQYASMARWVEYERARAGPDHIWRGDFQFGDWLDFFSTRRHTRFGSTSPDLIATAYFAHSVDILRRTAQVLGRAQDAARYGKLFDDVKKAFDRRFVTADGRVGEGTQTAYVLALDFDLLPDTLRRAAAAKLAADVRHYGHLTTGFLGTPHLLEILSRYGYLGEAYELLEREQFPSWLYPVTHGATTIWERWDGIKPDGSFESPSMNSFNHYAYGAVGEWMYRVIGGINIDPRHPGYARVLIAPQPGGGLRHARAWHESPYGRIVSAWSLRSGMMTIDADIPPNTRATIELPHATLAAVRESGGGLAAAAGVTASRQRGSAVVVETGSGRCRFTYPEAGR